MKIPESFVKDIDKSCEEISFSCDEIIEQTGYIAQFIGDLSNAFNRDFKDSNEFKRVVLSGLLDNAESSEGIQEYAETITEHMKKIQGLTNQIIKVMKQGE